MKLDLEQRAEARRLAETADVDELAHEVIALRAQVIVFQARILTMIKTLRLADKAMTAIFPFAASRVIDLRRVVPGGASLETWQKRTQLLKDALNGIDECYKTTAGRDLLERVRRLEAVAQAAQQLVDSPVWEAWAGGYKLRDELPNALTALKEAERDG